MHEVINHDNMLAGLQEGLHCGSICPSVEIVFQNDHCLYGTVLHRLESSLKAVAVEQARS